jgi:hypothetical protein
VKNKLVAFLSLIVLASAVPADTEFWSSDTFQRSLGEKVRLQVIPEIRVRNNLTDLYYFRTYFGPNISLNKNFGISVYYAPNYIKASRVWTGLGYLDFLYQTDLPWFALAFNNRERFEYDFTPAVLKLRSLFRFGKDGWFADDELFYNFKAGCFDEGRSQIGYSFKYNKEVGLYLSYLMRRQKSSPAADWTRTNAVNAGFIINI